MFSRKNEGFIFVKVECLHLMIELVLHLRLDLLSVLSEMFLHLLLFLEAVPLSVLKYLLGDL
jgi:hypothetical protein